MTNYEIIKKYLEHGFWAVLKLDDAYCICSSMSGIWIRHSWYEGSVEKCASYIWAKCDVYIEELENTKFQSITPMYPPFTPYKVGDLVDVLETVKEFRTYKDMADKYKLYPGKKWFEIKNIAHSWYWVWPVGEDEWMNLPHHVLAPHIPTTTPDTITIGWLQYSKQEVEDRLKDLQPVK